MHFTSHQKRELDLFAGGWPLNFISTINKHYYYTITDIREREHSVQHQSPQDKKENHVTQYKGCFTKQTVYYNYKIKAL